jgi:ribosome production factor 1
VKNIPRTIDNTRVYDSTSYLTADPVLLRAAEERAAEASRAVNAPVEEDEEMQEDEEEEESDEEEPKAGPSKGKGKVAAEEADGEEEDKEEDEEEDDDEEEAEEGAEAQQAVQPIPTGPPRILLTTSPGPSKPTYQFCDDLKSIFPGGEFFKRPKGRGFELGRVARWAAKRGYNAMVVVNEDHKKPSE